MSKRQEINYNKSTKLTGGFCNNCGSRVEFSNEYGNSSFRCSKCILKNLVAKYKSFTPQY